MSLSRLRVLFVAAVLAFAAKVQAQPADGSNPFYADKVTATDAAGEAPQGTLVQGSVTSSTFGYRELGEADGPIPTASSATRLYTDVRAQLDAKHIAGGKWDTRLDARVRIALPCEFASTSTVFANSVDGCSSQSGVLSGNEYDIRELFVRRADGKTELQLGRQFVPELAAIEVDGVRVRYQISEPWAYVAFAGLNPAKISRSIETDYPAQVDAMGNEGNRIMPITAGVGGAYRYSQAYGSIGVFGILPLAEQNQRGLGTGALEPETEQPRIAITGNGYWRQSRYLELYHYIVADVRGAPSSPNDDSGRALTNLSLGVNLRPVAGVRITAAVNQVDTETLTVLAERDLENPSRVPNPNDPAMTQPAAGVQNAVAVLRLASRSARLGLSAALAQQRFEVSVSSRLFERPDIIFVNTGAIDSIDALRGLEVMLSAVDRRSVAGLRLSGNLLRIFGLGGDSGYRATVNAVTLNGSREFADGRAEVDVSLGLVNSTDENAVDTCAGAAALDCFGSSTVNTISLTNTLFYRISRSIFVMAMVNVGTQSLSTTVEMDPEPSTTILSGFLRAAYRF